MKLIKDRNQSYSPNGPLSKCFSSPKYNHNYTYLKVVSIYLMIGVTIPTQDIACIQYDIHLLISFVREISVPPDTCVRSTISSNVNAII